MGVRWEEIQAGSEPEPMVVGPLTVTDAVRYQGASGDMNPVHHDSEFAKQAGFDVPLMVGMFQAGVLNTWATNWLGPENVRRTKVRWREPVFPAFDRESDGGVAGSVARIRRRSIRSGRSRRRLSQTIPTCQGVDAAGPVNARRRTGRRP